MIILNLLKKNFKNKKIILVNKKENLEISLKRFIKNGQ